MKINKHNKRAEINITPLVDVMLVLLVIFMVATPMMNVEIDVNLPNVETSNNSSECEEKAVHIFIDFDGIKVKFEKNEMKISHEKFIAFLKKMPKNSLILVYANKDLKYAQVFEILQMLKDCGFYKISLVGFKK